MTQDAIITVGDNDNRHTVGDAECTVGWCGGISGYPENCEFTEGCNGLVHAEFGDENGDGDYWLYYKCDQCGETS